MYSIRIAQAEDFEGMHRVRLAVRENRLVSLVLTKDDYVRAISGSGRGWAAEHDGEIVGFAVGNGQTGNIWALFVDPEHERQGIGHRLHDAMVAWLWEQNLNRLWLTTAPATRAERFYEQAGWQSRGLGADGEIRFELERPLQAHQPRPN